MIDIPAHVQHENVTQNHVQVRGGTNWDLSRSAVATPIVRVPDPTPKGYQPAHKMPSSIPDLSVVYGKDSVLLSPSSHKILKDLPAKSRVIVAGHADASEQNAEKLAKRRADSVAAQLKRRGHSVLEVKSFGAAVPKTYENDKSSLNRRVEIYRVTN